jgi:hypothetical protein
VLERHQTATWAAPVVAAELLPTVLAVPARLVRETLAVPALVLPVAAVAVLAQSAAMPPVRLLAQAATAHHHLSPVPQSPMPVAVEAAVARQPQAVPVAAAQDQTLTPQRPPAQQIPVAAAVAVATPEHLVVIRVLAVLES